TVMGETVMAFLGKLLVIVCGALSIAVFAWALGIYTQRISWQSVNKDDPGLFDRQKEKAEDYGKAADRALNRWSGNLATVQLLEGERYPRRAFYAGQKYLIETGQFGGRDVPQPVQQLQFAPNGFLDITKPVGRPPVEVRPGVAADSINGYQKKMAKLLQDIRASQAKNEKMIAERDALNREIVGVTQPMLIKGLRQLINEQNTITDRADVETTYVSGFTTNREAEFGLLKKRRDALTGRMAELEKSKKDDRKTGGGD
ncbi:MAG TPA: hypothetical protein VKD72_24835, partial [Gemmataceae bacterium]|nr:hypothetical protein [Gemmataceae bacterium]